MSIQLFRDNEFSERFDRWTAQVKNLQAAFGWNFYDNIETSTWLGEFIWDNDLFDLAQYFTREYFSQNFTAIIEALKVAGTFECYLLIIRSALGQDTLVTFDVPDPSHLIINISEPTGTFLWYGETLANGAVQMVPSFPGYSFNDRIGALTSPNLDILGAQQSPDLNELIPGLVEPDQYFIFQKSTSSLSVSETIKLIELLNVNGVWVEVNLVA